MFCKEVIVVFMEPSKEYQIYELNLLLMMVQEQLVELLIKNQLKNSLEKHLMNWQKYLENQKIKILLLRK